MSVTLRGLPRKLAIAQHNFLIRGIARTAPLVARPSGPLFLGMTCHRDVLSWLVALKSIVGFIGSGEFIAIDDGTLTDADIGLLNAHLPGLRRIPISSVQTHGCPRGGAWERLHAILDLTGERYVVQVDGDLVALGPLDEVAAAVRANRAFTLSGDPGTPLRSVAAASEAARQQTYDHLQHAAERLLVELPGAAGLRYVRGCAGFAGFPKGAVREPVTMLSSFMDARLGARWQTWGSEQVTSNFLIANQDDPLVLPWERYPAFFGAGQNLSAAVLIHFLGGQRYQRRGVHPRQPEGHRPAAPTVAKRGGGHRTGRAAYRVGLTAAAGLAVSARQPGNAADFDALLGQRLGVLGRGFTVNAASLALAVVDAAGFFREFAADIVAVAFHLGTQALQQRAHVVGDTISGDRLRRQHFHRRRGCHGNHFTRARQRRRHQRAAD